MKNLLQFSELDHFAGVAELADAQDLGFCAPYLPKRNNRFQGFQRLYKRQWQPHIKSCRILPKRFNGKVTDKLKKIAASIALGFLLLCMSAIAQERRTYAVPFHTVRGMILLDVQVNGKSGSLILDTGAETTILDVSVLALPQQYDMKRAEALHGQPGTRGGMRWSTATLAIGGHSWHEHKIVVMNLASLSETYKVKIDGLLGQDILRTFSGVRIDYKAQTVTLED